MAGKGGREGERERQIGRRRAKRGTQESEKKSYRTEQKLVENVNERRKYG